MILINMETEDKDRVLNYEGLYIFLEELKKYFIANPDERGAGRYLKCVNAIDGTVEWAEFPTLLTFKGTVDNDSQLPTTGNSPGDVWKVEHPGAEYVWILNPEGTEYIWEYLGELVRLTTHAGITDTATAGQVLVSKSNGPGSITYEWVTLNNNDTTYTFSQSGNTLTITPSSGSATTYTPTLNPGTVTSITAGRGLLGGTITSSGTIDIDTEVSTPTISSNAFSISYDSKNFIKKVFNDEATVTINVNFQAPASGTKYAKEVICRIDYDHTADSESGSVVVKVAATGVSGTLANMYDADITGATGISLGNGKSLELVFTFWDKNDVSFNGGISESIITRTAG